MRLIDADKLRKPIYAEDDNIMGAWMSPSEQDDYNYAVDEVWQIVVNAPTIDAVEVVRCGECKYYEECEDIGWYWCNYHGDLTMSSNDFCSYGERKE